MTSAYGRTNIDLFHKKYEKTTVANRVVARKLGRRAGFRLAVLQPCQQFLDSNLGAMTYIVALTCNGSVIDAKTFNVRY